MKNINVQQYCSGTGSNKYPSLCDVSIFEAELFQEVIHTCIKFELTFSDLYKYIDNLLVNGITETTFELLHEFSGIYDDSVIFERIEDIKKIIETIYEGYYIYELIDPTTDSVFYVGKGNNSRILDHERYTTEIDGHYNKDLHEKILEIKNRGDQVSYRILWSSIPEAEDAYRIEDGIIFFYGLDNLCNVKSGHDKYKTDKVKVEQIKRIFCNFNSWTNTIESFNELKNNDILLLVSIFSKAIKIEKTSGISMSLRDMALSIGVNTHVADTSIKRLVKYDFLDIVFSGKGCCASKYSITEKVFRCAEELPEFPKCSEFDHISAIRQILLHDAFRYKSLNKSGARIILTYILNMQSSYSLKELIQITGLSRSTIARALKKMVECGILTVKDKIYTLNTEVFGALESNLRKISFKYGTYGRYECYKEFYERQRYLYHGTHLRVQLKEYKGIPVDEALIVYILEKVLSRERKIDYYEFVQLQETFGHQNPIYV